MKLLILLLIMVFLSSPVLAIEPPKVENREEFLKPPGVIKEPEIIIEIPEAIDTEIKVLIKRWIEKIKEYRKLEKEIDNLTKYLNELLPQQDKSVAQLLKELGIEIKEGKIIEKKNE